jgi:hypothetical protein
MCATITMEGLDWLVYSSQGQASDADDRHVKSEARLL